MNAFDMGTLSDRFRHLLIDVRPNKKNFTIFENRETRDDTVEILNQCKEAIQRDGDNKLKICCL
jgi:hypothetical protein